MTFTDAEGHVLISHNNTYQPDSVAVLSLIVLTKATAP